MALPANAKIVIDLNEHDWEIVIDFKSAILDARELSQEYGCKVQLVRGQVITELMPLDADSLININASDELFEANEMLMNAKKLIPPDQVFVSMRSGANFYPFTGQSSKPIELDDIFVGLSRTARFNGQTTKFYSVGQHCVEVCKRVYELTNGDLEASLYALTHDFSEAFTGDLISPIKAMFPGFKALEASVDKFLKSHLGLAHVDHKIIKQADLELLATEKRDQMPNCTDSWELLSGIQPLDYELIPLPHEDAYLLFKTVYTELIQRVKNERTKQVESLNYYADVIEKGVEADEEIMKLTINAINRLNISSPTTEVISALQNLQEVLTSQLGLSGIAESTANSIFMGRTDINTVASHDLISLRLSKIMEVCGETSRHIFLKTQQELEYISTAPAVSHKLTNESLTTLEI
ncbi:hypothetical protein R6242_18880 [Iodobacter sp. CM08]|uniref:hypothetical protein n=1 Tax=Iodobacter sp. CM08 TaxID=3085902 RepID=UPI00298293E5|nr:hypothetical protein [Iodobacter sp. CM08]MDW5418634.1 hypothetical protein [Iodobacter sp. CM08]